MTGSRRRSLRWLVAALAVGVLGVSSSAVAGGSAAKCGSMTFDENAWAGATANVYVLKYVLEKNLGCTVNIAKLPESTPLFQAMTDGKVDVVLEDWNNIQLKVNRHFVTKEKSIVNLGSSGVIGHIGWFIPTYLMKQHPEFKTWKGLKGKESLFKSPESGSQGMFLGGDPTYVQKDAQLIKALGLNLKFVSVGAEPAQVARWTQLYKQKKPILFYWYTPQYLNTAYQLSEIQLPPRHKNCQDSYNPKLGSNLQQYNCAYGQTIIEKLDQHEVRQERVAGRSGDQALEVERQRPELRREPDRRPAHGPGEGGREVGQGQPRQGQGLAREVDPRSPAGRRIASPRPAGTRMATPTLHIHDQRAADARSLSDRAYYAIRELIVTLELAAGLGRQRAGADGAARARPHAGPRGAPRPRPRAARRGLPSPRDLRLGRRRGGHRGPLRGAARAREPGRAPRGRAAERRRPARDRGAARGARPHGRRRTTSGS